MTLPLVKRKKRKIKWCKHGVNKQKSAVKTIENNTLLIKICPKTRQVNTSFKNKFLTNNEFCIYSNVFVALLLSICYNWYNKQKEMGEVNYEFRNYCA